MDSNLNETAKRKTKGKALQVSFSPSKHFQANTNSFSQGIDGIKLFQPAVINSGVSIMKKRERERDSALQV